MQRRLASPCDQDFQRRHLHPTRRSCRALQHRRSSIPSLLLWVFLWVFGRCSTSVLRSMRPSRSEFRKGLMEVTRTADSHDSRNLPRDLFLSIHDAQRALLRWRTLSTLESMLHLFYRDVTRALRSPFNDVV
jgi:hypothetical protein